VKTRIAARKRCNPQAFLGGNNGVYNGGVQIAVYQKLIIKQA